MGIRRLIRNLKKKYKPTIDHSRHKTTLIKLGDDYGGYRVDPSRINPKGTVISIGIGGDASFDKDLLKLFPEIKVIAVDPTELAKETISKLLSKYPSFRNRLTLVQKAVVGDHKKKIKLGGNASSLFDYSGDEFEAININNLLKGFRDITLLKMDIEGAEYQVLDSLEYFNFEQLLIEWHHWLEKVPYSLDDTKKYISNIELKGFHELERTTEESWRLIQESFFIKL